jgi:uncharacterized protein
MTGDRGEMGTVRFDELSTYFAGHFQRLWQDSKPLAKLFKTNIKNYLYDTGTNTVFACDEIEFCLLDNLFKYGTEESLKKVASLYPPSKIFVALNTLGDLIEKKNILMSRTPVRFGGSQFDNLEYSVSNSLGMIQLEVTERCNLRCAYCLYGDQYKYKRNHGTRDMDYDLARKAIDHLAVSSGNNQDVAVTFYGGEPLLRVPFVKACVAYARTRLRDKEPKFSVTTNATLIDKETARYLASEEINVHVSIDGPEEIHNQYRVNTRDVGSFKWTISGLKNLIDAYGQRCRHITLSMVYSPPFSRDRIERVAGLWDQYKWLPRDIGISITYAQGFSPPGIDHGERPDNSLFAWARDDYIEHYRVGKLPHPISSSIINKELVRIVQRPEYSTPVQNYYLNGCCLPGARKQFVSVDGKILLCERVESGFSIGNIQDGMDIDAIKKIYVNEYSEKSIESCSRCWALQLCAICYVHAFSDSKFDLIKKERNCNLMRKRILDFLTLFCELLEIDGSGLDFLTNWKVR